MRRPVAMNASLVAADRTTHLKILVTSLTASIIAVWLMIALH